MLKKIFGSIVCLVALAAILACSPKSEGSGQSRNTSVIERVLSKKKLVVGTAPGYLPFEMKDKEGRFIGYDVDLGTAIGEALKVPVEFKQYDFAGLIPALQTGDIDIIVAGMTIRGDRALAVTFSDPYYATGQVLMVQAKDKATTSWKDLDLKGKTIAVSQGTTGALLSKQIFANASVVDYADYPTACIAISQGKIDGIVYDEPGIRMYEIMNKATVRGIYTLISAENLGIVLPHNDLESVQWVNSFLQAYRNSPADLASIDKWFKSTDWMGNLAKK